MKKRYYAAIGVISLATILLLAGAPSWLAILSLSTISIVLFILTKEEVPPEVITLADLDRDDIAVLSALSEAPATVHSISKSVGASWHTVKRRLEKLSKLGLVEVVIAQEQRYRLSVSGSKLVDILNSHFSANDLQSSANAFAVSDKI